MGKRKDDNEQAQSARRLFVFIAFILLYMNGISVAGIISLIINGEEFSIVVGGFFIIIFSGYLLGLIGIFKPLPPLHYGILIASAINLVISILIVVAGGGEGFLQGLLSFLTLYLGLRFPLQFADGQISYDTERLLS